MRSAHRIDIKLLHELYILFHIFIGYCGSLCGMKVMTVHPI